ncbi:hypothetical protein CHARACLAT_029525 [Characodon lateralis]|uniref:Uncharacterized protein n=1 Tax=Characodon lateralis TaxID=208331 RepID=A0ABU7D3M1_9TELE|nr:hypothetical protein [Characodon lateralis]
MNGTELLQGAATLSCTILERGSLSCLHEKRRPTVELPNGPLKEMSNMEEAKLDRNSVSSEQVINGPA